MGKGLSGATPAWRPPYVRGEDNAKTGQARPERETPPRAWGRLYVPSCLCASMEKHPHVRGEDIFLAFRSVRRL